MNPSDKYFYGLFSTVYYPKAHLQLEVEQKAARRRAGRMARRAGRKSAAGGAAGATAAESAIPVMPTVTVNGKKYYINRRTRNLYDPVHTDIPYVGRLSDDGATIDYEIGEKEPSPAVPAAVPVKAKAAAAAPKKKAIAAEAPVQIVNGVIAKRKPAAKALKAVPVASL